MVCKWEVNDRCKFFNKGGVKYPFQHGNLSDYKPNQPYQTKTHARMKDNDVKLNSTQKPQRGSKVRPFCISWRPIYILIIKNLYSYYCCQPNSDLIIQFPGLLSDSAHI